MKSTLKLAKCNRYLAEIGGVYVGYDINYWCSTPHSHITIDMDITMKYSIIHTFIVIHTLLPDIPTGISLFSYLCILTHICYIVQPDTHPYEIRNLKPSQLYTPPSPVVPESYLCCWARYPYTERAHLPNTFTGSWEWHSLRASLVHGCLRPCFGITATSSLLAFFYQHRIS